MNRLVHAGTKVTVHFGQLLESGDLLNVTAFDFNLLRLDDSAFEDLKALIRSKRQELEQSLDPSSPAGTGSGSGAGDARDESSSTPASLDGPNELPATNQAPIVSDQSDR